MSTRRENLLNTIKTQLEAITQLGSVHINRIDPFNVQTDTDITIPVCFVNSGEHEINDDGSSYQSEEHNFTVEVSVVTDPAILDIETLIGLVNAKMFSDITVGGYSEGLKAHGITPDLKFDYPQGYQACTFFYIARYELPLGQI